MQYVCGHFITLDWSETHFCKMKNLFDNATIIEIEDRIKDLSSLSQPIWGKMSVAQMLAHCNEVLKNSLGDPVPKRMLIGYLISPFWRHKMYNDQPYKIKNNPTYKTFMIEDNKNFETERKAILLTITDFYQNGNVKSKKAVHPLLGKFTAQQWAIGQYKHLDHHLRQFGS